MRHFAKGFLIGTLCICLLGWSGCLPSSLG